LSGLVTPFAVLMTAAVLGARVRLGWMHRAIIAKPAQALERTAWRLFHLGNPVTARFGRDYGWR
jgi:hypothetical protein